MKADANWRKRIDELLDDTPYRFYQLIPPVITDENGDDILNYVADVAPNYLETLRQWGCDFDFSFNYAPDPMMDHAHNEQGQLTPEFRRGMEIINRYFNCS